MSESSSSEYIGLREILHRPDPVLNAFVSIPDPGLAAIVGWSGFEFVVLDAEHAPFSTDSLRHCIDALAPTPAKTVIRIAANEPALIMQALDLGVDGVQVPKIADGAEAAAAASACRYSPEGSRGVGAGHASRYGTGREEYRATANAKIALLAMIETLEGVENAEEIAATEGVDAIVIGASDLAADMGMLGQTGDERVRREVNAAVAASVRAGTKVGTGCAPEEVGELGRLGMSLFACYFDGPAINATAKSAVARANEAWEAR